MPAGVTGFAEGSHLLATDSGSDKVFIYSYISDVAAQVKELDLTSILRNSAEVLFGVAAHVVNGRLIVYVSGVWSNAARVYAVDANTGGRVPEAEPTLSHSNHVNLAVGPDYYLHFTAGAGIAIADIDAYDAYRWITAGTAFRGTVADIVPPEQVSIASVSRIPTTNVGQVIYLSHGYSTGTKENAVLTVGATGGRIGFGDSSSWGHFGSLSKPAPLYGIYGSGSAGDYSITRVGGHAEFMASLHTIEIAGTEYQLDRPHGATLVYRDIINPPTGLSAATLSINFRLSTGTDAWYWTDGTTTEFLAGLWEWMTSAYARLTTGGNERTRTVLFEDGTAASYKRTLNGGSDSTTPTYRPIALSRAPRANTEIRIEIIKSVTEPPRGASSEDPAAGSVTHMPFDPIEADNWLALTALTAAQIAANNSNLQDAAIESTIQIKLARGSDRDVAGFSHANAYIGKGGTTTQLYIGYSHWADLVNHRIVIREIAYGEAAQSGQQQGVGTGYNGHQKWDHVLVAQAATQPASPSAIWGEDGWSAALTPWVAPGSFADDSSGNPIWWAYATTTYDPAVDVYTMTAWQVRQEFGVEYSSDRVTSTTTAPDPLSGYWRMRLPGGSHTPWFLLGSTNDALAQWDQLFDETVVGNGLETYRIYDSFNHNLEDYAALRAEFYPIRMSGQCSWTSTHGCVLEGRVLVGCVDGRLCATRCAQ